MSRKVSATTARTTSRRRRPRSTSGRPRATRSTAPIQIQFNSGAGHEDVVQIIIDNLATIGIQAEAEPFPTETYFTELADGACQICRAGWYADYPTYDNFLYDLFHSDAIGGNNHGVVLEPRVRRLG